MDKISSDFLYLVFVNSLICTCVPVQLCLLVSVNATECYVEAMVEQIRQQNAEYQKSLEERISVLVEEQKQLAELNEQQAQELKSLRLCQQHLPSTSNAGNNYRLTDVQFKYTINIYMSPT